MFKSPDLQMQQSGDLYISLLTYKKLTPKTNFTKYFNILNQEFKYFIDTILCLKMLKHIIKPLSG